MRRLIELLRGGPEDEGGDETDRRVAGLGRLDALVSGARAAGVDATLTSAPIPVTEDSAISLAVYRLVQEALTNVLRHAGPGAGCAVSLDVDERTVRVDVVDDGNGTPPHEADSARIGHGLVGMRERVAVLGGTLSAGPRAVGGWAVHARLPLPSADRLTRAGDGSDLVEVTG
jgi:signal transduction histidine kinase